MPFVKEDHYYKRRIKDNDVPTDVFVGDLTGTKFIPRIDFNKWGGEAWMSVFYPAAVSTQLATYDEINDSISLVVGDYSFHWYLHPDESLEFEIILGKKPIAGKNSFTLNIDFPAGMRFHYQPALTPEEIAEGCIRPENVVGSYAVYWNKRNNQYKTGKFCHIYRPQLTDALGNKIWADLNIDPVAKTLTITVDSTWLKNATYPVTIDPNFGYESVGGSNVARAGGTSAAFVCQDASPSGNITSIVLRASAATARDVYCTIYAGDGIGYIPGTRKVAAAATSVSGVDWYTFDVGDTALTQNEIIWLSAYCATDYYIYFDIIGSAGDSTDAGYYTVGGVQADPFGTPTAIIYAYLVSIYGVSDGSAATKPLMGNWLVDASTVATAAIFWKKFVAPENMTVSKVQIFCDNAEAAINNVHAAIYGHDAVNDLPQERIAYSTSSSQIAASTAAFVEVTLSSSASLTGGTTYWIAGQFDDGTNCRIRYCSAIGSLRIRDTASFGAFPDPAPDSGYDAAAAQYRYTMFCQGDEAAGGATRNLTAAIAGLSATVGISSTTSRAILAAIVGASTTPEISSISARILLSNIFASSLTPEISAKTVRAFLANIFGASATVDISSLINRAILSTIPGVSVTPNISATTTRAILSAITGMSITPDTSAIVLRNLLASVAGASATTDISAIIARALLASISGASTTTDITASMIGVINLIAAIAGVSTTPDISAKTARILLSTIIGSSVTPDISASVVRAMLSTIAATSTTPDVATLLSRFLLSAIAGASTTADVFQTVLRSLIASIPGASSTSDITITISGLIQLLASIAGTSVTPNIDAITARTLLANIQGQSQTANVLAVVLRKLLANIQGASITSDITITLENFINLAASIAGISLTSDITIEIARTLSALITGESITPDIEATVVRMLLADIHGTSITPDDLILILKILGAIIDPSFGSLTPVRSYQSIGIKRTIINT